MRCTFFNMSAATIVSKWRGDSEKIIKVLFDLARYYQPSVIFLDEIDSIMSKRGSSQDEHEGSRRMKTELLIQLDGLSKKDNERVFLLAASNLPWDLDGALLRRLEKRVIVNLPDEKSRIIMLKKFITGDKQKDLDYDNFAKSLDGYSGSDIRLVCKEALMKGVRRAIEQIERDSTLKPNSKSNTVHSITPNLNNNNTNRIELITNEDFSEAMQKTRPASFYKSEQYETWMDKFGSF
jgi:katanin p60 ATPase-containing subunit A1